MASFHYEDISLFWDASKTGKVKFSSGLRPNMKMNLTFPVFSGKLSQIGIIAHFLGLSVRGIIKSMFYEVIPEGRVEKLTYSFDDSLLPGQIVEIPLGRGKCVGIVSKKVAQPDFKTNGLYKSEIYIEHFLYPPVKKGDIVGSVVFYDKCERVIDEIPLVSCETIASLYKEEVKISLLQKIKKFIERLSI